MTIALELDCGKRHCGNCEYALCHSIYDRQSGAACVLYGKDLAPEHDDVDGSFIDYLRLPKCRESETGDYSVLVSRPIDGINGDEHLLDEQGRPLEFLTFNDAIAYLAARNYTLADILQCQFIRFVP
jgi:hypothetical protein